jgi:hypothetical protein
MMHDEHAPVNFIRALFSNLYASITAAHRFPQGSGPTTWANAGVPRELHARAQPVQQRRVKTLAGEHFFGGRHDFVAPPWVVLGTDSADAGGY